MTHLKRRAGHWLAMAMFVAACLLGQPVRAQAATELEAWIYRVSAGDTLISICAQFLERPEDWPQVQKLNRVPNERQLQPGSMLRIPLAWIKQTATVANVVFVKGLVSVVGGNGAGASRQLAIGDAVQARDLIRTAVDSSVSLRLADGSRMLVTPGAEVRIVHLLQLGRDAIPKLLLQIESGGAEIQVAPGVKGRSFDIRTPAVNLGVRGTDFRARVDPAAKTARVEVREGRVDAAAERQELPIPAGFGTVAEAGKPIEEPRHLIAAPALAPITGAIERVPLRFTWAPVAGASGYRAQVLADGEPVRLLLDGEFLEPFARWPDLPDGSYRLRVRAIDSRGNEGHDADAKFVIKARPEAPFKSVPADASIHYGESARFEWGRVVGANRYRLQIAGSPDFSAPLFDDSGIENNTITLKLAPGTYHWRVASIARAADGRDDPGPWGNASSFTQRPIPPSPPLQPPETNEAGVTMRWQVPAAGQKMQFQVARDKAFTQLLIDQTTQQGSALLPKPAPGSYYMRARTIDADGFEGPYGAVQQIDVAPPPPPPPPNWLLLLPLGLLFLL